MTPAAPMRALVVDDDIVSRMALADLLAAYGVLEVVEAADGEQAWALLEQGLRPVICFSDVHMPRLSGVGLLARMKAHPGLAEIPMVLVSSASDRDTMLQAVKLGAAGVVLKPLRPSDARAHLERVFQATLDRVAEHPEATMQRLALNANRLAAYFGAFGQQIAQARSALAHDIETGAVPSALGRLAALRAGCTALGLWELAERLEQVRQGPPDPAVVEMVLADAVRAVAAQSARLGALLTLRTAA
jgi:two-component system chemotaxis response regulator CheY